MSSAYRETAVGFCASSGNVTVMRSAPVGWPDSKVGHASRAASASARRMSQGYGRTSSMVVSRTRCVIGFHFCRANRRWPRVSNRHRMQSRSDSATEMSRARGTSIELTEPQFLSKI